VYTILKLSLADARAPGGALLNILTGGWGRISGLRGRAVVQQT